MNLEHKDERIFDIQFSNVKIENSGKVTLLAIKINKNVAFKSYIS